MSGADDVGAIFWAGFEITLNGLEDAVTTFCKDPGFEAFIILNGVVDAETFGKDT